MPIRQRRVPEDARQVSAEGEIGIVADEACIFEEEQERENERGKDRECPVSPALLIDPVQLKAAAISKRRDSEQNHDVRTRSL